MDTRFNNIIINDCLYISTPGEHLKIDDFEFSFCFCFFKISLFDFESLILERMVSSEHINVFMIIMNYNRDLSIDKWNLIIKILSLFYCCNFFQPVRFKT